MAHLIEDVEAFCEAQEMAESRFGVLALNDKNFIRNLREDNRRVWPETEAKVRRFMATYRREDAAA